VARRGLRKLAAPAGTGLPAAGPSHGFVQPKSDAGGQRFLPGGAAAGEGDQAAFLIGGSYAINAYTGQNRGTKDVDFFCLAGDYPRILAAAAEAGFETEVEDERWIAKIKRGEHFCDVIWGSANAVVTVTEAWFRDVVPAKILDVSVRLLPPAELIWSKAFILDRKKFDGSDVAHIMLREHKRLDWQRLLSYFEQHWEVLLAHLILFRYIYPTERATVPDWLLDELLTRLALQRKMPVPNKKPCRGRIFSRDDYEVDIRQWGFADLLGDDKMRDRSE
jgi:hypothetical protein